MSLEELADKRSGRKSGEAVCFRLKLASQMPSQDMLLMFVKSLWLSYHISSHLWLWSCLSLQGKFRRANFIFQGNLETISAVFELLGFPQGLAFSRAGAAPISFSPWSSCMWRRFQNFKDCCWVLQAQEVSFAKFRLDLFTDFWQDSQTNCSYFILLNRNGGI